MADQAKVLDSWAIIAFFENEPAAQHVEELLISSLERNNKLFICVVNLGEVWYSIARAYSPEAADTVVQQTLSLGVETVPVDWELALRAVRFKARGNIAYADCFAAALAIEREAELVTGDPEFEQFQDEVKINRL
jgi:predicted nucleic acid-binding protein